jgi:hypothetical protein
MIELGARNSTDLETLPDRLARKSRPVLDATEAFFFQRDDKLSVTKQHRRAVGVISVYS